MVIWVLSLNGKIIDAYKEQKVAESWAEWFRSADPNHIVNVKGVSLT